MYIKKLESWDDEKWSKYFKNFSIEEHDQPFIRQILTMSKEGIESNFEHLKVYWIINWIWPSYFPAFLINFITWLLPFVKFEWHDIMVWLAENELEIINADIGIKKYSQISVAETSLVRLVKMKPLLSIYDTLLASPIKWLIVYFLYVLVRAWSKYSINPNIYKNEL